VIEKVKELLQWWWAGGWCIPFAQLGIPAHTVISSSDEDAYYHSLKDEPSTFNYEWLGTTTRVVAISMKPIINGTIKPSRIDTSNYTAPAPFK